MVTVRQAADRGHFDYGWLNTHHTFSFSQYYDPKHMGFRSLRVINDDRVSPGMGFGTHPHQDMEIITVVLDGALQHKDSMGFGSTLHPGDIQYMSAGTGVTHSEFNPDPNKPLHFFQIWIMPDKEGYDPQYAQEHVPYADRKNRWVTVAKPGGGDKVIPIRQDVVLSVSQLDPGVTLDYETERDRGLWLQVMTGDVKVSGTALTEGSGLALENETALCVTGGHEAAHLLLFDLK